MNKFASALKTIQYAAPAVVSIAYATKLAWQNRKVERQTIEKAIPFNWMAIQAVSSARSVIATDMFLAHLNQATAELETQDDPLIKETLETMKTFRSIWVQESAGLVH